MTSATVPTVKLNNGLEMPVLGFGVFQIPADETEQAVIDALEAGYRSLDTARSYMNEEAVGRAITESEVPREEMIVDLIEHNEITPAINQVECHPFFQRADYQQLPRERGVQIESWGPFAEGRNNLFSDPTLSEIGAAHDKSVAQVVLRWLTQRGVVVVQKSVRAERMRENFDIFDFELTDDEMARIAAMDRGESLFFDHHDPAIASQFANRRLG